MKILIVTQVVDTENLYLGFFTRWIEKLAPHFDSIEVICLTEGTHTLPANVRVHSLGKESLSPHWGPLRRLIYIYRFKLLAWKLRTTYDVVFVHMNQEYILVAGPMWTLLGKRIYMWRNHYAGSWLTDLAAAFCTKIFCTSRFSYTAKYKKTVFMPVGIDTERFHPDARVVRNKHSILFFARIAPSKNPLMLVEALRELKQKGISFTATFAGPILPEHEAYYRSIVGRAEHYGLFDRVTFLPGIPHHDLPDLYRAHEIYVNCAPSGMLDKTLFEAAASGCLVLAASDDFRDMAGERAYASTETDLTDRLVETLSENEESVTSRRSELTALANAQSLDALTDRLSAEID